MYLQCNYICEFGVDKMTNNSLKARIIRIGNSQGIRIPKILLTQAGLSGEVEIEASPGQIVIKPIADPREGWEEDAREMVANGDEKVWDDDMVSLTKWDEEEWEW
jgi:antitoxin MazE